jgi:hypothetical protein
VKFFTKELWNKWQDVESLENRDWQQPFDQYNAELQQLRNRIDPSAFHFFSDADVHDGELLNLVITDGSRPAPLSDPPQPWDSKLDYPVRANLEVLDSYEKLVWKVSYEALRRVLVDYPTDTPLFYRGGEGFGDWGYHELSDAGEGFLRHEILFATGAVLLFEFKDVAVSSRPWQIAHP